MSTDTIIEAVARRAASDSAFRRRALADADAVLAEMAAETGAEAPAAGSVVFVATAADAPAPGARAVALPASADDTVEMEDADLEQVAGGCQWGCSNLSTDDHGFPGLPTPPFQIPGFDQ